MFTIYKASAGSGKTFRLVGEYLKEVLKNGQNYKHILAVTFTNKATAEMKERVTDQLYKLSSGPEKSPYTALLIKETRMNAEEIKTRSKEALRNILHDYNRFSISTIDKFTQKVIKSFNRELGLSPGYTLELDNDTLLQEATDRLILKAGSDKELLRWMARLGEERIRANKSVNIRTQIIDLGQELFREKYQELFTGGNQELYNRKNLKAYRKELRKITDVFETVLKAKGEKGLQIITLNNLTIQDFSYGIKGVAAVFRKVVEGNFTFGKRILEATESPDKWVGRGHPRSDEIYTLSSAQLMPLLSEILEYYDANHTFYITAQRIIANLFTLGLLKDLQSEIDGLRHEKGILPISDSNLLLKRIIAGSDSPFIYEKTGDIYHHFMLDEFQDTSGMQWENFKPLILNSLAEGKDNLAVGDVKQSIYRWRNGNWKILSQIEAQFSRQQLKVFSQQENWRSDFGIIRFNNAIFPEMVNSIKTKFEDGLGTEMKGSRANPDMFSKIYEDLEQHQRNVDNTEQGYVRINFIGSSESSDYKQLSLSKLLKQVKELQDSGFSGSDIAILVRQNSEGGEIAGFFLDAAEKPENNRYNLEIISNESLFLTSSKSVTFIIQLISHLVNPEDKITKANILNEYDVYLRPELVRRGKDIIGKIKDIAGKQGVMPSEPLAVVGSDQLDNYFEEKFRAYFSPVTEKIKTTILNASVDEAIATICQVFNLFELEEDLPYLQGLIDQAAQIKTSISNDLSNFLMWWNEKGRKLSVNLNDDSDAIRLMTIHKAKGLEFKVVLIPFFDWPVSWKFPPVLWCEPRQKPFNTLPFVPVRAVDELADSIFRDDYFAELSDTYIDNLNLVYVAFTRAVSVLLINAPSGKNGNNHVNDILSASLNALSSSPQWNGEYDENESAYSFGRMPENHKKKNNVKRDLIISGYTLNLLNSRLKLRTDSDAFFDESGPSNKNLGKLLHEILAQIKSASDIEKACRDAMKQHKINRKEYEELVEWLRLLAGSVKAKGWFTGEYDVLTERNLLSETGIRRPDRIMIKNGKAVVVDYKLGESAYGGYHSQVREYAQQLKDSGLHEVEGYLWYLRPNKIEKVCNL